MLTLLSKLFIKDYKNVKDPKVRDKYGRLASVVGIISNLLLAVGKIVAGILFNAISIITDGINNLSDIASSVVTLIGFHISGKPADKKHPFGHERFEYVSSLVIAIVMLMVCVELVMTAIKDIINGGSDTEYSLISFIVLGSAILIKLWQGLFYRSCSKKISSLPLKAASVDSLSDTISTSIILVGSVISYFAHIDLDAYLSIAVALLILKSSIELIRESINPLLGEPMKKAETEQIISEIMTYPNVLGCHDAICHSYGPTKKFMTIHVEVDGKSDIIACHELIDEIEQEVGTKHNICLTIHMDPVNRDFENYDELKEMVKNVLASISEELHFHDFRLIQGGNRINMVFDVVVPFDFKYTNNEITEIVNNKVSEIGAYCAVISYDREFTE